MMKRNQQRSFGFTLIELLIILFVLVVTLALAVPAMQEMVKNNRLTGQANEMISLVAFARNEALRRNESITLVIRGEPSGWDAEVLDPDGDGTEACGPGALRCAAYSQVQLDGLPDGEQMNLVFNNRGYLDPFSSVDFAMEHVHCTDGQSQRRNIVLRPTGQLESCRAQCGSFDCE